MAARTARGRTAALIALVVTACASDPGDDASCDTAAGTTSHDGSVVFAPAELAASNAGPAIDGALIDAVIGLHEAWLRMDADGYVARLAPDVTRSSLHAGRLSAGRDQVRADLQLEWDAYERTEGRLGLALRVRHARFAVEDDVAQVTYWLAATGGVRWEFDDLAVVFDVFVNECGTWRLHHHTESWGQGYDLDADQPGEATFEYDFVHPVDDLARAIAFYTPLLGAPEATTADWASFNLRGRRFHLDAAGLLGAAGVIRPGLPNGYAVFYADDLGTEQARLAALGVEFLDDGGTRGPDPYRVARDPAGNAFAILERRYTRDGPGRPELGAVIASAEVPAAATAAVRGWLNAWLATDDLALAGLLADDIAWFDDTFGKTHDVAYGRAGALARVEASRARFDHADAGLLVRAEVDSLRAERIASDTLVSYRLTRTGLGDHGSRDTAFVTHVVDADARIERTFVFAASATGAPVAELDYSAYPVVDLAEAEAFYQGVTRFADTYTDEGYVGFWSVDTVFGIFESDPAADGIPRANHANAYVSFWIRSADEVYLALAQSGATFPVVPAINNVAGVDPEPGYRQIYATDSERNGVVFTEYTGD